RPVFQNLQYSDTPTQPLVRMQFIDRKMNPEKKHNYRVIAVNTVGLKSKPSAERVQRGELIDVTDFVNRRGIQLRINPDFVSPREPDGWSNRRLTEAGLAPYLENGDK